MTATTHPPFTYFIGDTWVINAILNDADGNPLNLNQANVSVVWTLSTLSGAVALSLSLGFGIVAGSAPGSCTITAPATQTRALVAGNYSDAIVVTMPDGTVSTQVVGSITCTTPSSSATPNVATFRQFFPEFAGTQDGVINQYLYVATFWVDPLVWSAKDYPVGLLYLAAHNLQLFLIQQAAQSVGGTGATDLFVRQVSFGERRIGFQQRRGQEQIEATAGPGEGLLSQTVYGQQYLQLRSRNVIPVGVV